MSTTDAPSDAARRATLARQVAMAQIQIKRSPYAVFVADTFIASLIWRGGLPVAAAAWLVAMTILGRTRQTMPRRMLRAEHDDPRKAQRVLEGWFFAVGSLRALAVILASLAASPGAHYLVTMLMIGLAAGNVAVWGGMVRLYAAWVLPLALTLAASWLDRGDVEGVSIALLLMLLFAFFGLHARDFNRVLMREMQLGESLRHERDRAEAAIVAKTRFFAAASHDLRQPIAALRWYGEAVVEHARALGHERLSDIGDGIGRALAHAQPLLDQYLEISQLDAREAPPAARRVDVGMLLQQVADAFAADAGLRGLQLRVEVDASAGALLVESDEAGLRRILDNLVGNALKFTPAGSVTLSASRSAARPACVRIGVRDTGIGIDASNHVRVFDDFFQVANAERSGGQGVGLGLAIARRHAELLGTRLRLESRLGEGTVFEFELHAASPFAPAPTAGPPDLSARDAPVARALRGGTPASGESESGVPDTGLRLLVIDDEEEIRRALGALLEARGWSVATAGGIDDALGAWHAGPRPHAILVDHRLRDGRTGAEVIAVLRAAGCDAPAAIITGDTAPERLAELRRSGLPVLHKPVSEERLLKVLGQLVDAGAGS